MKTLHCIRVLTKEAEALSSVIRDMEKDGRSADEEKSRLKDVKLGIDLIAAHEAWFAIDKE